MAHYAIHGDGADVRYTFTSTTSRRIEGTVDCDPSQIAANTPSGSIATLVADTVSPSTHYMTYSGGVYSAAARVAPWSGSSWVLPLTLNGSSYTSAPTVADSTYTLSTGVWTANGSSQFSIACPPVSRIRLDAKDNSLYLPEAGTIYQYGFGQTVAFTTHLGTWYPAFNSTADTTYVFEVDAYTTLPFTLEVRAV
jgi:hypothetical protein